MGLASLFHFVENKRNLFIAYGIKPLQAHIRTLNIGNRPMSSIPLQLPDPPCRARVTHFKYMKPELQVDNVHLMEYRANLIGSIANSLRQLTSIIIV